MMMFKLKQYALRSALQQNTLKSPGALLLQNPQRFFPRYVNKEIKFQKESKYRFKVSDPDDGELKDAKSRKDYEMIKEGERMYNRFNIEQGQAQDAEYEKEIDRLIDEKMSKGLDDQTIIDQIVNNGKNTMTRQDYEKDQDTKIEELIKSLKSKGQRPLGLSDVTEDNDFNEFQQKTGKMMYDKDQILREQWMEDERQRRLKEREEKKQSKLKSSQSSSASQLPLDSKGILKSSKKQRSIEGPDQFGYVQQSENVKALHPKPEEQNLGQRRQMEKDEEDLEKHLKEFDEKKMDKLFERQKKKSQESQADQIMIKNLQKEVQRQSDQLEVNNEFKEMVEQEEYETKKELGLYVDDQETKIIGKQARHKTEDLTKESLVLTKEQKIMKELNFVTTSLDLNDRERKHWYYRIKREVEEEEKAQKRLEQREARKQFLKLLKSYQIPEVLEQEEEFEKIYDSNEDPRQKPTEDVKLPKGYMNHDEYAFYGEDVDFMRFHKRTTENVYNTLCSIIESQKQTIQRGVNQNYKITINHIELNKACSVVNAFWQVLHIKDKNMMAPEVLITEIKMRRQEIDEFRQRKYEEQMAKANEQEQQQVEQAMKQISDLDWLQQLDQEKLRITEAELQKRLTKASPFIRGRLCQILGLRYSPELRFFKDNSLEQYEQIKQQAYQYLKEVNEQPSDERFVDKQLLNSIKMITTLLKMPPLERKLYVASIEDDAQREQLSVMFMTESLQQGLKELQEAAKEQIQKGKDREKVTQVAETRRAKRAENELNKFKHKIALSSGESFDNLSEAPLTPLEMEESLISAASSIKPKKHDLEAQLSKNYTIDPETGEKTRIHKGNSKASKNSKTERKKEKSLMFWDKLSM
ncbi:rbfa domain containing protein [Stylonychia lemnae]|uniref:Rbfa domain containing protein n=1 Tax=Stylonychia lemnae TaxID=5949 RepID=A0A078AJG8_STYLE|nr:rbfa domain containing protein [Stylonychia lemnae]|eukprot:CDW81632.1 rbfa domain containing protein [Stylonychia lemnae]